MEQVLETIKQYADEAHGSQMRKYTPERYIVHPVRVMETCRKYTNDTAVLAAALLHDVLEDTPVTRQQLYEFLVSVVPHGEADRIISLVVDLTDVYVKKDFPKLNRRTRKAKENERISKTQPDSQTIKYADIIDNCNEIVVHDPDFARVFLFECRANLKVIDKGNRELYQLAKETVDKAIQSIKGGYR